MKQFFLVLTFLFCVSKYTVVAQVSDTTIQISAARTDTVQKAMTAITEKEYDNSNDYDPGLFLIGLTGLGIIIISVGAGIIVSMVCFFLLLTFVSVGIVSTSIIVGLHKKSFERGFKIFIISSSSFAGTLLFTIVFWAINHVMHWFTTKTALLTGACFGLVSGFILGLLVAYILKKLTNYFKGKLHLF
jgi:hypothetical protein